jgi:hypothetical protein
MNKQSMPMDKMHNIFWREDQLVLTFHSPTQLISDGEVQGGRILGELGIEQKLSLINSYLKQNGINNTLSFLGPIDRVKRSVDDKEKSGLVPRPGFSPRTGISMFDVNHCGIKPTYGEVNTSIVCIFNFTGNQDKNMLHQMGSEDEIAKSGGKVQDSKLSLVVMAVNLINMHQKELNSGLQLADGSTLQLSISACSPTFYNGGTPSNPQGCPLTPPMPEEDDCALWRFKFQKLTPSDLQNMTGKGTIVFILDSLPDLDKIKKAAENVGDDNLLLLDAYKNVAFHDVPEIPLLSPDGTEPLSVGKDVYGRHFAMVMPDHGLFIAGIVRDLAPDASVECIRVLNRYCVGDLNLLTQALVYIESRMSEGGDLYQLPVVINMSLVIPTKEELQSGGMDTDLGGSENDVYTSLRQQIQSLVCLGAIIVASAGNEGDLREDPSGKRPGTLLPAAFANPPYSIDGIIPVGAVNRQGIATSYSCYPGLRGIATYGGEIPSVDPKDPVPNNSPIVTITDAVRGIYSSDNFPPLSSDPPALEYPAPKDHAWAYWVGTSFATPIISALVARILDWKKNGGSVSNVHDAVIAAAGTGITNWDNLDPATTGVMSGVTTGPMIMAKQRCKLEDIDDDDEDEEIEIIGEL